MDDQVDVAPVDAEVERRGTDHCPQPALRHGRLDLAPLFHRQRAVMHGDGQHVLIGRPQLLEQHFGLAARVDEQERRLVLLDGAVEVGDGVKRGVPGPGDHLGGLQDLDMRPGPALPHQQPRLGAGYGAGDPVAQQVGAGDGGAEGGDPRLRRQGAKPRDAERHQLAALVGDHGVQFVEHDAPERAEQLVRIGVAQQQRQLLGRGQQDLRRIETLPLPPMRRGIAGAGLDPDAKAHLADRRHQVALHVHRQRLERREIERVQTRPRVFDQIVDGRQEAGQRLAGTGRGDQQRRVARLRRLKHRQLMGARRPALAGEPVGDL